MYTTLSLLLVDSLITINRTENRQISLFCVPLYVLSQLQPLSETKAVLYSTCSYTNTSSLDRRCLPWRVDLVPTVMDTVTDMKMTESLQFKIPASRPEYSGFISRSAESLF